VSRCGIKTLCLPKGRVARCMKMTSNPTAKNQRSVYEGNSILRGGREPVVEDVPVSRNKDKLIIE